MCRDTHTSFYTRFCCFYLKKPNKIVFSGSKKGCECSSICLNCAREAELINTQAILCSLFSPVACYFSECMNLNRVSLGRFYL